MGRNLQVKFGRGGTGQDSLRPAHGSPPAVGKKAALLCFILFLTSSVLAAEPSQPAVNIALDHRAIGPSAPGAAPHKFWDNQNKFLIFTGAGLRAADVYTTRQIFHRKGEDGFLPRSFVSSTPRMAAFSAAAAGGTTALMYLAHRRGHHRVERALGWAQAIFVGNCVIGNVQWVDRYGSWPKRY